MGYFAFDKCRLIVTSTVDARSVCLHLLPKAILLCAGLNPEVYEKKIRDSYVWKELHKVRNVRPSFHSPLGLYGGLAYTSIVWYLFRGKEPWTLSHGGRIYVISHTGRVYVVIFHGGRIYVVISHRGRIYVISHRGRVYVVI